MPTAISSPSLSSGALIADAARRHRLFVVEICAGLALAGAATLAMVAADTALLASPENRSAIEASLLCGEFGC